MTLRTMCSCIGSSVPATMRERCLYSHTRTTFSFFFNDTATTEIYTLSLHDALPISLFQPFNRLGQESGAQEGTGIGLVVTKRLVELMGGSMGVTSESGTGSQFWIELDAESPRATSIAARHDVIELPNPDASAHSISTVLCVEYNPSRLELLKETLALRNDLRLLFASNGHEGVAMARRHLPDVILMDNNMPVLNGSEAQAILRRHPATP